MKRQILGNMVASYGLLLGVRNQTGAKEVSYINVMEIIKY